MPICFPISPSWNKSQALPRAWETSDQRKQANLTQFPAFRANTLTRALQFQQNSQSPTLCRAGHNPGHFSCRECQDSMCLLSATSTQGSTQRASSVRFLLSPDPILRVWACTGCETFSVEALKSL